MIIKVNTDKSYNIHIEKGLLDKSGSIIRSVSKAKKAMVISDSNVHPIYFDRLKSSLEKENFEVFSHVFPAGEQSKILSTVADMISSLAENCFIRNDIVIALGGGVTGDMSGLCASLYMRGIDYIQIPTSLLAQIDSSVGGKTAVDIPQGKNLCGAFYQPSAVIIDPDVLKTLPDKFFSDGMAEAIKYGLIRSKKLFDRILDENAEDFICELIEECVDIKRIVVENDEKELGERKILNFGHTFGHAIEKYHNYETLSHGEAVGLGMIIASEIGEERGITEKGTAEIIRKALKKYSLPTEDISMNEDLKFHAANDKKRTDKGIQLVVIDKIGNALTETISV